MSFKHGKNSVFKLDDGAGTLVDISQYLDDVQAGNKFAADDVTSFGDFAKAFIQGLSEGTLSLAGSWNTVLHAQYVAIKAAMRAGTISAAKWEYAPGGTATGMPKISGNAILTTWDVSSAVGAPVKVKIDAVPTGDITEAVY